jgi:hypothetical protein
MIDIKNGVWENGSYTGRQVKTICMPTLNNHGAGSDTDSRITSAIKCFYGATEIHGGVNGTMADGTYYNIHSSGGLSVGSVIPQAVGELVATYLKTMFALALYITSAIWSGRYDRTTTAAQTNTVLACANPVTLDYVSCRDNISPYASWLKPDQDNQTRKQILGCMNQGIGTVHPAHFEVITYDFNHPTTTRLDIERKVLDFKAGRATDQNVKDVIKLYMSGD